MKIEHNGEEIEVYTAAELEAAKGEVRTTVEGEYKPQLTAAETEKERLNNLLKDRAEEFKGFRKLRDEDVAKLDVAQRTIYENGLALNEEREKNAKAEKDRKEMVITTAIKGKAGADEKLATKIRSIYDAINVEANTPEEIERRLGMALGAIGASEPDLLANVAGFSGGSYKPPQEVKKDEGFGATDAGKAAAKELGLILEPPKKEEEKK